MLKLKTMNSITNFTVNYLKATLHEKNIKDYTTYFKKTRHCRHVIIGDCHIRTYYHLRSMSIRIKDTDYFMYILLEMHKDDYICLESLYRKLNHLLQIINDLPF